MMKDPERRNRIEVLNWRAVPFYQELYDFKWLSDFLDSKQKKRELRDREQERKKVEGIPPDKGSFVKRLRVDFDKMETRQKSNLVQFLRERLKIQNPLEYFQGRFVVADQRAPFYLPTWAEFEEAVAKLDFTGGISDAERASDLKKITEQLETLDRYLSKLGYEEFNKRKDLVTFWRSRQADCTAAISPCGVMLEESPKREQAAWKELKLDKLVLSHNRYLPNPGEQINKANLIPPPIEDASLLGRAKRLVRERRVLNKGLQAA